jgi:putative pyruvate formate lyase activating enzyme
MPPGNALAESYRSCLLCPRACRIDRSAGREGACGEQAAIRAACACLHFGEEPPLTGRGGSGTVFFTGCTLRCGFCQNWQTSSCSAGAFLSEERLAEIFLLLQSRGAENINIVTGTQFLPGILASLHGARGRGLSIPMVWNSSGYETLETVALLAPEVSFFLPDLKTLDPAIARDHLHAADYPSHAAKAIRAMAELRPLRWEGEMPTAGTIVRHLVLPGCLPQTREVLGWFRENLDGRALLSLMFQYTPVPGRPLPSPFDRMISREEYEEAVGMLEDLGLEDGFYQEPVPDAAWLPDFSRPRPFSSELSRMVWHYGDAAAGEGAVTGDRSSSP